VDAVPDHDDIRRSVVLDLQHHPFVRRVRRRQRLGHDAVEPGPFELDQPAAREVDIRRRASQVQRMRQRTDQALELGATFSERNTCQVPVALGEQVERDEHRRGLHRELLHPAVGGVDTLRERLPVEPFAAASAGGNDDLAVEYARAGKEPGEGIRQLRKVAREHLGAAAADLYGLAVEVDDRTEAVPFRFEAEPAGDAVLFRDGVHRLGEHRRDRGRDRGFHGSILPQPGRTRQRSPT